MVVCSPSQGKPQGPRPSPSKPLNTVLRAGHAKLLRKGQLLKDWTKVELVLTAAQLLLYDRSSDALLTRRGALAEPVYSCPLNNVRAMDVRTMETWVGQPRALLILELRDGSEDVTLQLPSLHEAEEWSTFWKKELPVRMLAHDAARKDQPHKVVATIGVGSYFGEVALVCAGERTATVTTTRPSVLLRFSSDDFENLCSCAPGAVADFM